MGDVSTADDDSATNPYYGDFSEQAGEQFPNIGGGQRMRCSEMGATVGESWLMGRGGRWKTGRKTAFSSGVELCPVRRSGRHPSSLASRTVRLEAAKRSLNRG